MIRIQQMKLPLKHTKEDIKREASRILSIPLEECLNVNIIKQSIDARKKKDIHYIYTVDVEVRKEKKISHLIQKTPFLSVVKNNSYQFPLSGECRLLARPVIVGSGPAGLFCALLLAKHGYAPLVIERGERIEEREPIVQKFWNGGKLDLRTNVQFGEGGAGTFSDGKLNTLIKDNFGRNRKVLECFVEAGAPEEILYLNKAHIGTDVLRNVVRNIRYEIEAAGGEIRFCSQLTDILFEIGEDGKRKLCGIEINGTEIFSCEVCVLAVGHSARDTFSMLYKKELELKQKAFAIGVRIQHPQQLINMAQYGEEKNPYLPAADYKVTYQASNNRSIYSFCMCPGGYVVNASSEEGRLAINGMSYHSRAGENANSALIVSVTPQDFGSDHPLAGIEFQRRLEEIAHLEGQGKIPLQLYRDFCNNQLSTEIGEIKPGIKGGYTFSNLRKLFPVEINQALLEGIQYFGTKIKGFDRWDALLAGVESRTSSPIRIVRDEQFESNISGLYPCGEGAGYAGGITSAAMDGIKVAEAIAKRYYA